MTNMYTEYNDERVKQLMNLSKKDFPHVAEYMLCLMFVDSEKSLHPRHKLTGHVHPCFFQNRSSQS